MLDWVKNKFKETWAKIKAWFHDSETLFLARLDVFAGFIIAALATLDWAPLLVTGLTFNQILSLGTLLFIKGVVSEWARRRRDPEMN